jgi:hypothetical protein
MQNKAWKLDFHEVVNITHMFNLFDSHLHLKT